MQKIMFNERYGLQSAVLEKIKTHTRRESFESLEEVGTILDEQGKLECYNDYNGTPVHVSRYAVGEVVAIAQSYSSIFDEAYDDYFNDKYSSFRNGNLTETKGWNNKMFVKAELMPHHIKILDIRCERLQDISESDCIKEGVLGSAKNSFYIVDFETSKVFRFYTAKECFLYLLNLISKKEHRNINPYVIVYEFELID